MFRIKVTVHILLKKRRAVNNNTLLDAQKRQKTPLIVVESVRKHPAERNRVNSNE